MRIPPVAGNKLDSSEANCVANCAGRFLDSSVFVVNRMMAAKHATPWPDLCRASSGPASRHGRSSAAQGRTAALSPHPQPSQPSQPSQPAQPSQPGAATRAHAPHRVQAAHQAAAQRLHWACATPTPRLRSPMGSRPVLPPSAQPRPQPSPVLSPGQPSPPSAHPQPSRPQPGTSPPDVLRPMCCCTCACADAFPFGAQAKRQQGQ